MPRAVLVGMLRGEPPGRTGSPHRTARRAGRSRWIVGLCPSGSDRDLAGTGSDLDVVPTFDLVVVGAPPVGLAAG